MQILVKKMRTRQTLRRELKGALSMLLCAITLGLGAVPTFSQETTGGIQGVVKDQTGGVIPSAKVTVTSPNLVRSLEATASSGGGYLFRRLPVGTYTVTVTRLGFKTLNKEGIEVHLGKVTTCNFDLLAGDVAESVTVAAEGETLDITSNKTGTNITEGFIDTTPKGRSFDSLLQVTPGVIFDSNAGSTGSGTARTSSPELVEDCGITCSVGPDTTGPSYTNARGVGGFSVDGASGSENTFIIDGVEVSNVIHAALGPESAIPSEFVREIQVKSVGLEAEYSGATGGVINVITKSGSNDWHGQGALLFTNAGLNSSPRGFWQRDPTNQALPELFRQKEDAYSAFYPVFEVGGPILKDRLCFFAGYAPETTHTERTVSFTSGTRTTTNRLTRHYALARIDYTPTGKIKLDTSYRWTPIRNQGLLTSVDPRIPPPTNDLSIGGGYRPASAYAVSFTYTPTSKLILSAGYGYKYLNDRGDTYGLPTAPWVTYGRSTLAQSNPPVPAAFMGPAGKQNVSDTFQVLKDITTRHNVYLDASYIAYLFGHQHSFKGGYALSRAANDVNQDYPHGRFDIYWGEGFTRGSIFNERGTYGIYIWVDGIRRNSQVSSRNHGFYIQDAWQINPRVTLNLGARFESEFLPPFTGEVNGVSIRNPISFGWGDKISPRIGGAWDVLGNGRWKLSAGYGEYYDTLKYGLARTAFGGDYSHDRVYRLNDADISKLSRANPGALGPLIIDINNRVIPINAQGQLENVDPAIKPMAVRTFTVASEHNFGANMIASVRYIRKRLIRAIEDIGVLDAEENEVYTIGNPGFGLTDAKKFAAPNGQPLTPKARRDYDGLVFRFDHRFPEGRLRNLSYSASYTYSRLYGNWVGLYSSVENRAYDFSLGNFDSKGHNVYGRLPADRPHQFKLFANYEFNTRAGVTALALSQLAFSGTPQSSSVLLIVPVFYNGRGDLGRTPTFTQTDLLVAHTFRVSERVRLKVDVNISNLFNQATATGLDTRLNRSGNIPVDTRYFFGGFNAEALVNPADSDVPPARNPTYGLPVAYQGIREIRLGFRLQF